MAQAATRLLAGLVLAWPATAWGADAPPTFHRDIAPLLHAHCAPCHRPGQAAPFSLLTFADAQKRAADLVAITQRRVMPPWLPGPESPEFLGARRLAEAELDVLRRWAEAGAPEGDPAAARPPPAFPAGWQLGEPDLVAAMPETFTLAADGPDEYRHFVLPVTLDGPQVVGAVEFVFDNPRVVHHAVLLVDRTPSARELDARDPAPGFSGFMAAGSSGPPDGRFIGWTPGRAPVPYAPGEGWRLAPGSDLVLQLHLRRTGRPEAVRARVGLHFTDTPPHGRLYTLVLRDRSIAIPAGATNAAARDAFRLPVAAQVLAVAPHAHFLAHDLRAEASLPGGIVRTLLHIPDWDFNWQDEYRLKDPIALPAGTEVRFRYTFDNSAANPRNPLRPPRDVAYGRNATDEMAELLVLLRASLPEDVARLREGFTARTLREDLARHLARLRDHPGDARAMKFAALRHRQLGENDLAIALLWNVVKLEPDQAEGRLLLGEALLEAGQWPAAEEHLGRAMELAPDRPEIRLAWARLLASHPDTAWRDPATAARLARAVIQEAGDRLPAAWEVLALAFAAEGDAAEACEAAARALRAAEAREDGVVAARVRRAFRRPPGRLHPAMRVPEFFHHCPRCGVRQSAVPAGGVFDCAACGFRLFFNAACAVVAFIRDDEGRWLFIRRAKDPAAGKLAPPGGFIDIGERAEDALRREIREEVGLELADVRFLTSEVNSYYYREVTYPVLDLCFTARVVDPHVAAALDDVDAFAWLKTEEVAEDELAFPSMRAAWRRLRLN